MKRAEHKAAGGNLTRRGLLGSAAALSIASPFHIARAQSLEPLSVRVDFAPWGVQAALHLAMYKGWFKDAGLSVDLQDGTGTLNTINLVAAGRSDVGLVQLGPMAIGRSSGLPLKSFAGFLRRIDLAVLVDAKTGPKEPKGLAGKKLVCFAGSTAAPFIDPYLKRIGVEKGDGPTQCNVVMVSPPSMVSTYASGGADGFISLKEFGEPLVMKTRPARSFLAADVGLAYPSYGLMAAEETIAKRGAVLKKLNETQVRAWTYMFADPKHIQEGAQAVMAQRPNAQLDQEILTAQITMCREFFETPNTAGKPMGWQSSEDWKLAVASMTEAGLLKETLPPEAFFTNDLIGA
jgi:NitT/TauT family transport system substrate-binding protein